MEILVLTGDDSCLLCQKVLWANGPNTETWNWSMKFSKFNTTYGWWVEKKHNMYHLKIHNIRKINHIYSNVWNGCLSVSLLSHNFLDRWPFTVYPSGSYSSIHLDFCHLPFHLFSLLSVSFSSLSLTYS